MPKSRLVLLAAAACVLLVPSAASAQIVLDDAPTRTQAASPPDPERLSQVNKAKVSEGKQ